MTPRTTTIKRVIDEIFELTHSQKFSGSLSGIGLKFGLSAALSKFIPAALVRYSILLRNGVGSKPKYEWRREMCGPNQTLAARLDKDYSDMWGATNSRKMLNGATKNIPTTKVCSKCKKEKPIFDFGRSNKELSGRRCQCKECDKTETRARRLLKGHCETTPVTGLSISIAPDEALVSELRRRGFEVVAQRITLL